MQWHSWNQESEQSHSQDQTQNQYIVRASPEKEITLFRKIYFIAFHILLISCLFYLILMWQVFWEKIGQIVFKIKPSNIYPWNMHGHHRHFPPGAGGKALYNQYVTHHEVCLVISAISLRPLVSTVFWACVRLSLYRGTHISPHSLQIEITCRAAVLLLSISANADLRIHCNNERGIDSERGRWPFFTLPQFIW